MKTESARVLLGRDRHVQEIDVLLDAVGQGHGNLVLFSGEAGVGKTRLAEEAVALARQRHIDPLWVTCWGDAGAPPLWPWAELVRTVFVPDEDEPTRRDLLGRLAPDVAADPPDVVEGQSAESGSESARFRLFDAMWGLVRLATTRRPLLFVMEDLHLADSSSIRLLCFLAPLLRSVPVLVIATYRDTELEAGSGLDTHLPDLVRNGRHLILQPLSENELGRLVSELVGTDIGDSARKRLHWRTGGNPLFLREVLQLMEGQVSLDRAVMDSDALPDSVRSTLGRRLHRVSAATRRVLEIASGLGSAFDLDVLQDLVEGGFDEVITGLDEATRARLVVFRDGRAAFTHPLICETAYAELGLSGQLALHARIGETLERRADRGVHVDVAELAHHFGKAAPAGDVSKAFEYAKQAGEQAMSLFAYEAAAAHFEDALALLGADKKDGAQRADLLLAVGEAQSAAGDLVAGRATLLEAAAVARSEELPVQIARAALGLGAGPIGFEVPLFDDVQMTALAEAATVLSDRHPALLARVLARQSVALSLTKSESERQPLAEAAVKLARDSQDRVALASALASHCDTISGPEMADRRRAEAEEIVSLARSAGDLGMELLGRRLLVVALLETGAAGEVDTQIEAFARIAEALRQPLYRWYPPLWRGMRALMTGHLEESDGFRLQAEHIGLTHSANAPFLISTQEIAKRLFTHDAAALVELILVLAREHPDYDAMIDTLIALATAESGDIEECIAILDRIDLDVVTQERFGREWLTCAAYLAMAIWRVGGHALAAPVYDVLEPYRSYFVIDGIGAAHYGSVERYLGLLAGTMGRSEVAAVHLNAAIDAHRAIGAGLLLARTLEDAGVTLGDESLSRRAIEIYERLDMDGVAERVRESLPRPVAPAGAVSAGSPEAWFYREADVWTLTYAGRTIRLRHRKGMSDLATLLARPAHEVHVLDLMAGDSGPVLVQHATGEAIDASARTAYRARLLDLEAELGEADLAADVGRVGLLHTEREALIAELASAYGMSGRVRRSGGDSAERARSAVTQRLRETLRRIESEHPRLGRHLRASVRTGFFCAYDPESPVTWHLERG